MCVRVQIGVDVRCYIVYYIIIYYILLLYYILSILFSSSVLSSVLLFFLSLALLIFCSLLPILHSSLPSPHSKYTCRHLDILIYIPLQYSETILFWSIFHLSISFHYSNPLFLFRSSILLPIIFYSSGSISNSSFLSSSPILFSSQSIILFPSHLPLQSSSSLSSVPHLPIPPSLYPLIQSIRVGIWISLFIFYH